MINITKPYKDDMIIPFTVYEHADGEADIDVYEEFYDVAVSYLEKFKGEYFSHEALSFIENCMLPGITEKGYVRYEHCEYYHVFAMSDVSEVICASNQDVSDISDAVYDRDETDFDADVIKEYGQPASLIVEDGTIAAIAASNYFIEDDEDEVELAVETLERYRGRGYAKAVLSDMARKVFDMGRYPVYRVSCNNHASIATAKACGFKSVGKEFYYNCYKEDK